jgi:hypothetical protein
MNMPMDLPVQVLDDLDMGIFVATIAAHIAHAVAFLQNRRITHRDIKDENIMVGFISST